MDVFDLVAKITMDTSDYESKLSSAKSAASESGSGISSAFGTVASGVGRAMSTVTKVTAAAIGAAATGVSTLTTLAVKQYAQYEQMEGGISKIFGTANQSLEDYAATFDGTLEEAKASYEELEATQQLVMDNAANSWKTAGTSANEYMETVTALSGALMSSLDYDKTAAAEYADRAITDMSDIANTYGYTMDQVSGIYTSISRGLYQTLDTLTAGAFAGTKAGYQDLIDTMADATDIQKKLNITVEKGNYDYDNFVNAMSVYNEKVGIAGTTAKEASTTISGSLSQMSAAWSNLLTGIADENANIDDLMGNLVDSIVGYTDDAGNEVNGFLDNIIPVVETSLTSIGTLIEKLVPEALDLIPSLITDVLPKITNAATELVGGLVSAFSDNMDTISSVISQILTAFVDLLPDIISLGGQIISTLATAIVNNLDAILAAAGDILEKLTTGLSQNTEKLVNGAIEIITKLMGFLTDNADLLIDAAVQIIEGLTTGIVNNLDVIIEAGIELAMAIFNGLLDALPELLEYIPDMISTVSEKLVDCAPDILEAATTMFLALVEALPDILVDLIDAVEGILMAVVNLMSGEGSSEFAEAALTMFLEIVAAVPEILGALLGAIGDLLVACVNAFNTYVSNMYEAGKELWGKIKDAVEDVGAEIIDKIKEKIEEWKTAISDKVNDFKEIGKNLITGLWNGISDKAQWLYDKISGMGSTVVDKVKSIFGVASPSKVFAEIGGYLAEGLGLGWDEGIEDVNKQIDKDLKYEGEIDIAAKTSGFTAPITKATERSESNLENARLVINNTTVYDGDVIEEKTYEYMIQRMGDELTATKIAEGGGY